MSYTKNLLLTCLSLTMIAPAGAGTGRNLPSHFKGDEDTRLMRAQLAELQAKVDALSVDKPESTEIANVPVTLKITGQMNRGEWRPVYIRRFKCEVRHLGLNLMK